MAKKYDAGVKEYRDTYFTPDYVPLDTDLLACFKCTGQEGVPKEEVAAAVAAESSTGTWSTVWSELLVDLEFYKGRCYRIEDVPGDKDAFYAFIAYPLDLFEEGSITNVLTSLVGNVFGFKALRHLRLEDIRFPMAFIKTCGGPPSGIVVERDRLNKYGRPLLGCTIKPKLGLSGKNYGRVVYECLRGGLDLTKDDENINSQPFQRWRERFEFVAEAYTNEQFRQALATIPAADDKGQIMYEPMSVLQKLQDIIARIFQRLGFKMVKRPERRTVKTLEFVDPLISEIMAPSAGGYSGPTLSMIATSNQVPSLVDRVVNATEESSKLEEAKGLPKFVGYFKDVFTDGRIPKAIKSAATHSGLLFSSATTTISDGPATRSIPTFPKTCFLAAAT